jgi:hypothetical protein
MDFADVTSVAAKVKIRGKFFGKNSVILHTLFMLIPVVR